MTALNHRLHWWQAGFLVIALLLAIGSSSTILADETVTTEHPASNNALTFLGTTWRSGFQTKLHSSNVASKETVKLSAQGGLSLLDYGSSSSIANPISSKKISYNWWVSTDQQTFHLQSNSHDSTFKYTAPSVSTETTVRIQVSFTAKHVGLINIQTTEYWSNVAFITVMPNQVPASGITIKPENQHLLNSDTTTVHATLTPPEATDTITWCSSNTNLATVDEFGTVTASKANDKHEWSLNDHGQVTIKATIDNMSATTTLTVGMLQDQTINEGGSVTFQLTGLPKDENGKPKVKVDSWHRGKISSDKFEEFKTDQDHFTVPLAMFNQDNDTLYYATLIYTGKGTDGNSRTEKIDTNVAKLTVNNTHAMSLVTVPSFQFRRISLNAFKAPQKTTLKAINQRATAQPSLLISDLRQSNQHWQLSATLAPFTSESGSAGSSIAGKITADLKPVHTPDAKATSITIGQKGDPATPPLRGSQSVAYYLDNSQLQMRFNPQASPGQYCSKITWTLAAVP